MWGYQWGGLTIPGDENWESGLLDVASVLDTVNDGSPINIQASRPIGLYG